MGIVDVRLSARRYVDALRSGRPLHWASLGLLALAVIIVLALLYGDLPEFLRIGGRQMRDLLGRQPYLPGFALLYIEESGVPLPAPGDVFVMYVGTRVPHHLAAWILAWLGLILAVVLGATNLYLISRRFGRHLVESSFGEYIHLSPERIARADAWFKRYGVLAIIFGRHIPGFRIPITVASGIFGVRYPVFAASVAVSTAIWAGVVLIIGINYGPRLENLLRAHTQLYFVWGGLVLLLVATLFVRQRRRAARARRANAALANAGRAGDGAEPRAERPVESPGS
jgi:membrane protein DedA with SNARE-associated domain